MTYTAFDLHRKLTEEEGMDPQSEDYYTEVDKRIRLEFPHKFDRPVEEKQTSKPTQNVASATRSTKSWSQTSETHIFSSRNSEKIRCATRRVCETTYKHEGGIGI